MAFKEAARKANPVILEPVMSVEAVVPEVFAGSIMGDLSSRRGLIKGIEHCADSLTIRALVPLAELLGYSIYVRSSTQGRAAFSMNFIGYEVAPHIGESGADEAGVTANKPTRPKASSGFAAANLDTESE